MRVITNMRLPQAGGETQRACREYAGFRWLGFCARILPRLDRFSNNFLHDGMRLHIWLDNDRSWMTISAKVQVALGPQIGEQLENIPA